MKLGWKIVLGSFIGFFGAAFGSIGGVGGGGIFVPMLTLIIGFDPKSSAAMSKCEDSVHIRAIIFFYSSIHVLLFLIYIQIVLFAMKSYISYRVIW